MPSLTILLIPSALQALAMPVDESVFHRRRGLLKSERIGHPLDAVIVAACYAWLLSNPEPSERAHRLRRVGRGVVHPDHARRVHARSSL
jgi:hypothetical protein